MRSPPALLVLLVAGACAQPSPTPASSTTLPSVITTAGPTSAGEAATMFRTCLLSAGIDTPEIQLDVNGRPDLEALVAVADQGSKDFRAVLSGCAGLLVGAGFLDLSAAPGYENAVRIELANFAVCMRSQGVEEFPDLPAGWDGTTPPFQAELIPVTDPQLGAAIEACGAGVAIGVGG